MAFYNLNQNTRANKVIEKRIKILNDSIKTLKFAVNKHNDDIVERDTLIEKIKKLTHQIEISQGQQTKSVQPDEKATHEKQVILLKTTEIQKELQQLELDTDRAKEMLAEVEKR